MGRRPTHRARHQPAGHEPHPHRCRHGHPHRRRPRAQRSTRRIAPLADSEPDQGRGGQRRARAGRSRPPGPRAGQHLRERAQVHAARAHDPDRRRHHGADRVILRIADTGPGVPDHDQERIFTPFQRLGDIPDKDGVGLGLAVARGLTEAMGGTVATEETPGGGLTFVLDFPRPRGDAMTFVLVVDDDPAMLRTLSINLRARDYDVETAGDGRSALQIVDERMPDVVLLDLGLPDIDGDQRPQAAALLHPGPRHRRLGAQRVPTTRSRPSTWAPTTSSPSRSRSRSCSRASGSPPDARRPRSPPWSSRSATSPWTSPSRAPPAPARRST